MVRNRPISGVFCALQTRTRYRVLRDNNSTDMNNACCVTTYCYVITWSSCKALRPDLNILTFINVQKTNFTYMRWNLMLVVRSFLQSLLLYCTHKDRLMCHKRISKGGFENAYRIMMCPLRYYFNPRSRKGTWFSQLFKTKALWEKTQLLFWQYTNEH